MMRCRTAEALRGNQCALSPKAPEATVPDGALPYYFFGENVPFVQPWQKSAHACPGYLLDEAYLRALNATAAAGVSAGSSGSSHFQAAPPRPKAAVPPVPRVLAGGSSSSGHQPAPLAPPAPPAPPDCSGFLPAVPFARTDLFFSLPVLTRVIKLEMFWG